MEYKKEPNINFEELILRQLEVSIEMKERLQSKAASYITADALIMSGLLSFLAIIISGNFGKILGLGFYVCSIIVFGIGLIEFVICSIMLLPRMVNFFTASKLMGLYHIKDKFSNEEIDKLILDENEKFIDKNDTITDKISICYILSSVGILVLVIGFLTLGILFFISIRGGF